MQDRSKRHFLALAIFSFVSTLTCQAQSIPVPEYYGIYVVLDGQLIKLDSNPFHPNKTTKVNFGIRNGVGQVVNGQPGALPPQTVQIPVFPADLKIVVYGQSAAETVQSLHLIPLVFVNNLSVDTGFPKNIRRTDPERGWDDGEAVELPVAAGGDKPQDLEILVKPFPGQKDMVIGGFSAKLNPGVYRIRRGEYDPMEAMTGGGKGLAFAVEPLPQAELTRCVNETLTYMMVTSKSKYSECNGSSVDTSAGNSTSPPGAGVSNGCSDYDSCFKQGLQAFEDSDWQQASTSFESATKRDPTKGEGWAWLGRASLASGNTDQFSAAWDKVISLGDPLILVVCHEKGFMAGNCERGDFVLDTTHISFGQENVAPLFSVAPSAVTPKGSAEFQPPTPDYFRIRVANKNYNFDVFPFGVKCDTNAVQLACPPEGLSQQVAIDRYVSGLIAKLASGAISVSRPASVAPPTPPPKKSICETALDAPYSIVFNGHLYKAKIVGPVGPTEQPLFFDEKGVQVLDAATTFKLSDAVWTHDNVIASTDVRQGAMRVSDILGTSKAITNYTTIQDLLAKSMAEALAAGATGGASLATTIPRLAVGVVTTQLLNAPKTILTLVAIDGLTKSLDAYKQLGALPLPPADETALNASDLVHIKELYLQARTLELPYSALAAKLMPTSGQDLTVAAFKSAVGQLAGGVFPSSDPTAVATLKDLFVLHTTLGEMSKSLPALQAYSENVHLVLELNSAGSKTISKWAAGAALDCRTQ